LHFIQNIVFKYRIEHLKPPALGVTAARQKAPTKSIGSTQPLMHFVS
jgi:hypothetical protein